MSQAVAQNKLSKCPVTLAEANEFVRLHHRHHHPVKFHKFSIGAILNDAIVGVAIVHRPVAIARDDGLTLEVARLCTDGTRNACSFLYGASAKAAFSLGYQRIGTYIAQREGGASLRASGWKLIGETRPQTWIRKDRPRVDTHPLEPRFLFETKL